jgi:hypothetical protein
MALAYRELDPRGTYQPYGSQVSTMNPYAQMMQSAGEASTQRQMEAQRISGQADAQQRVAALQKQGAWTQGLDALTRGGLQGAKTGFDMSMQKRQAEEQALTGASQRAYQTSQMETLAADRDAMRQRLPVELEGLRSQNKQTEAQTGLIGEQKTQATLQNEKLKAVALYENSLATAQNFPGALEGESVMGYIQRNEAEGKVANTQMAKAQAGLAIEELKNAPENQRLNRMSILANIQASKAASANAAAQTRLAEGQFNQNKEVHDFDMEGRKVGKIQDELSGFSKALFSGQLYGNLSKDQATEMLKNKMNELYTKHGVSESTDIAFGRTLARMSTDAAAAQAAQVALANLHPASKINIERGIQQAKLADSGAQLLSALKAEQQNYNAGAGKMINSQDAIDSANRIQLLLDEAGNQSPVFKAYAEQFRGLNRGIAGFWTGDGRQALDNLRRGPQQALESLITQISGTIKSQLEAIKYADPLMVNTLNMATQNFEQKTNPFFNQRFNINQPGQPQQSLVQPLVNRP